MDIGNSFLVTNTHPHIDIINNINITCTKSPHFAEETQEASLPVSSAKWGLFVHRNQTPNHQTEGL